MSAARCLAFPHLDFFSSDPLEQQAAQDVCAGCDLRTSCLAGARARNEPWGVWGGEVFGLSADDVMVVAEPARIRVTVAAVHGSRGLYASGCRCRPCTDANASYVRGYRDHGPVTARETVDQQFEQMMIGAAV